MEMVDYGTFLFIIVKCWLRKSHKPAMWGSLTAEAKTSVWFTQTRRPATRIAGRLKENSIKFEGHTWGTDERRRKVCPLMRVTQTTQKKNQKKEYVDGGENRNELPRETKQPRLTVRATPLNTACASSAVWKFKIRGLSLIESSSQQLKHAEQKLAPLPAVILSP